MKILVEFRQGEASIPARVRVLKEAPSSVDPFGDTQQGANQPTENDTKQSEEIVAEIAKALSNKRNETARTIIIWTVGKVDRLTLPIVTRAARLFWQQAKDSLPVKPNSKFRFLGAGAIGLAFEVDGLVLKVETEIEGSNWKSTYASVDKLNRASNTQWSKNDAATDTPMVYDRGTFALKSSRWGSEVQVSWFLIEKFETFEDAKTPDEKSFKRTIQTVLTNIRRGFALLNVKHPDFDAKVADIKRKANKMARYKDAMAHYRLQDNWIEKLANAMIRMNQIGTVGDYHIGNLGIRRTGSEGYAVFFD